MTLGEYLRMVRHQKRLTLQEVESVSKGILDKTTVSRIERDDRRVSFRAACAFSKVYGISLDTLANIQGCETLDNPDVPFDTSDYERRIIIMYRNLSSSQQKTVEDIVRGLLLVGDSIPPSRARERVEQMISSSSNSLTNTQDPDNLDQ